MKILIKIILLLLSSQIVFGVDFQTPTSFFGNAKETYNSGYQNVYEKAALVNLFGQAAEVASSRQLLAEKNSLDYITTKIKALGGKNGCDISTQDVTNIFLTTPAGVEMKKKLDTLERKISYPKGSDYNVSCMKVLKCYGMSGFNNLTVAGSLECKSIVAQSYSQEIQKARNQVNIQKPILNPDMFFNGKTEAASEKNIFGNASFNHQPWDIMNDYNEINSIIFKDPKSKTQADEDIYLTSPPAGGQCKKACGFDEIKDGIDKAVLSMNLTISNIKSLLNGSGDGEKIQQLHTQLLKLQQTIESNSKTFDSLSQGSQVGAEKSYENVTNPDEGGGGQKIDFSESNSLSTQAQQLSQNISGAALNIKASAQSLQQSLKLIEQAKTENRDLTQQEKTFVQNTIQSVEQNISNQQKALTQASNQTQALDKIVKLDTMLCVQVCWVETKKAQVSDGGQVSSIEEIIDQYHAILSKVKNSGSIMKQRVTDEFWETSMPDLKLKNLVNIDFVVTTKPVFDNKTLANKIESQELETQKLREGILNQGTNLHDSREKNKYLVLYSPADRKMMDSPEKTLQNLQASLEKQQEVYENLKQNYAKVHMQGVNTNSLEKINIFMSDLVTFTEQMGIIFKSFKDSSDGFLNNIMQGVNG